MKKVIIYVLQGWCSDDASWANVFVSLCAFGALFFLLSFLLCGWMFLIYHP